MKRHFKEIPMLTIGQDVLGFSYVYDRQKNICGIFDHNEDFFYISDKYKYAEALIKRLIGSNISFDLYAEKHGPLTLQTIQEIEKS